LTSNGLSGNNFIFDN